MQTVIHHLPMATTLVAAALLGEEGLGEAVLTELERVLATKLHLPRELRRETQAFLRREAEVVEEGRRLDVAVRDEDDVLVLEQAAAASVDVLVTGDRDLLDLGDAAPVPVLDLRGFWALLRAG